MQNFWYEYKFGETPYMMSEDGQAPLLLDGSVVKGGMIENGEIVKAGENLGPAMRDLYTIVIDGFQEPILVAFYVLGMIAIAFHLIHGFQSGFQSLGLKNRKIRSTDRQSGICICYCCATPFRSYSSLLILS